MQHIDHRLDPRRVPGFYDPARADEIQAFIPAEDEHFVLPGDITKAAAIATIASALRLCGETEVLIAAFRQIADRTERTAWHSESRAPVNWRRQCDLARELGITERHFRRLEARLEALGVLARATADNGYRGRRSGQGYHDPVSCGLSLEPAIANYPGFVAMLAEAEAEEAQRQKRILHVRSAKRRLRHLIGGIADRETHAWARTAWDDLAGASPPGTLRGMEMAALETVHAALLDLEDRIRRALEPLAADAMAVSRTPCPEPARPAGRVTTPAPHPSLSSRQDAQRQPTPDMASVDTVGKQQDMSGAPDSGVRCHIQPQLNRIESCNVPATSISTPACAGEHSCSASPPNGDDDCLENKDRAASVWINPAILQKLTPETLRDLASEDAALYLEAVQDWCDALPYLLRELGVNVSAWLDAVDVMGEETAFIALLVIDRNRFHPVTPIQSPGGALRAFTDRARNGELNLTRAVLGIWERDRQGTQPKAGLRPERLS